MRIQGRFVATLAVGVLTAAACGSGSGGGSASGPIVIGEIASLTGNYTPLGTSDKLAAQQAVNEINKAGGLLGGRKLKLMVKDDQTTPAQAVIDFNDLTGQGVTAIIGSPFSNAALATIPLVARRKVPYMSPAASDQQVEPVRPYVFMTPADAGAGATRLLSYFKAVGMTRVAVAYDTKSAFAVTGHKVMAQKASSFGVHLVDTEKFETTTNDFSSVFTHVRDSGARALMVWATGAPAVLVTKQFATAGLPMKLVLSHAEASSLWMKPSGAAAEGVLLPASFGVVGPELPASKLKDAVTAMAGPYQKANGTYPPQFAFDGYAAVKLLAAAITKAGSTDGAKIQRAMEHLTLLTPSGEFHYTPTDHAGLDADDLVMTVVKGGKFTLTPQAAAQLTSLN